VNSRRRPSLRRRDSDERRKSWQERRARTGRYGDEDETQEEEDDRRRGRGRADSDDDDRRTPTGRRKSVQRSHPVRAIVAAETVAISNEFSSLNDFFIF